MMKGKWKPIILWRLRIGNTSLSQLERDTSPKRCYYLGNSPFLYPQKALDMLLELENGFLYNELYKKMEGHIIDQFTLIGSYPN